MPLSADLATRLDAGSLIGTFTAALGDHGSALQAIDVPADPGQIGSATSGLTGLDTAGIGGAISQLAEQATSGLTALVPGLPALDGIQATLALIEQALQGDLAGDIGALAEQLGQTLEGSREGGTFSVFMRISNLLADAPVSQNLASLLRSVLTQAGVALPPALQRSGELLPAVESLVRGIGGLMMLESVLSESERLTGVMAQQLDAPTLQREFGAASAMFDSVLTSRIGATNPLDAAALQTLANLLGSRAERLDALWEHLASGMGLGEATLAYLDVEQVQREVTSAATLLRGLDLAPLQRLLADALGGLNLGRLDIGNAPAQSIDTLLGGLEAQIGSIATQIESWDAAALAAPVTQGIQTLTAPLGQLDALIGQITVAVRSALEAVRQVVVSLPLQGLIDVIQTVLAPVTAALTAITALVGTITEALETAAQAALDALGQVEGTIDGFKAQIEALFGEAKAFIDGLHLDTIADQIREQVTAFVQLLQQAQMKPYFDTAVSAIGTAADVVGAVPFDLLPDSMKADVDAAVKPIKDTDVDAAEAQIESALGIGSDGTFQLRGELEDAVAEIQAKYDALIDVLEAHDPQQYLAQIDAKLSELAAQIQALTPDLTLQPVQDAITQVKQALGDFDLRTQLAPLQQVFDQALAALNEYSPARLIDPIEARIDAVRTQVKSAIRIEQWAPALDDLVGRGTLLLNTLDPARLQPQLQGLFGQAHQLVGALPDVKPAFIGTLITQLLSGTQARIFPQTFQTVQGWLAEGGGPAALTARTEQIASAVQTTRDAVRTLDVGTLAGPLLAALNPVRSALGTLLAALPADAASRPQLQTLLSRFDPAPRLAALSANRSRFLALLESAATLGETLRRTGLSEVDGAIEQVKAALQPLFDLSGLLKTLLHKAGLSPLDQGLPALVRGVFDVLPPARLAALLAPIFNALRGRVLALVNAVLTPVKDGIQQLNHLIDAIDLGPLKDAVDAVYQEILAELQALSPATLLAAPLAAFDTLKAELATFDPLAPVLALLNGLRDTAARVLAKLSTQQLLATPLEIYRDVLAAFGALDIGALLAPVLDLLDTIAKQVDDGLDETVTAFKQLQAALPSGGGGSSASVAVAA